MRRAWLLLLVPVVLAIASGVVYAVTRDVDPDVTFCGGVGLFGPAASTPEEAVAAWVRLKGGDPGDYDKIREGYWDVPDSDPRYLAITVSKQADGRYSVDGACVK